MPTEAEIDAAAKVFCCGDGTECIPSASYCAVTTERDFIRRILLAAEAARVNEQNEPNR